MGHLIQLVDNQINRIIQKNYWTTSLGLARTCLALCTFLTLFFNENDTLFVLNEKGNLLNYSKINVFSVFWGSLTIGKTIASVILIAVMTGVYPRITAFFHAWVSFSFYTSCIVIEGGDHITTLFTLLLLPVLLFDKRTNHWKRDTHQHSAFSKVISLFCYFNVLVQVAIIYFHASVGKFFSPEWLDGTAVYYWINDPTFGANGYILSILNELMKNEYVVVAFTWGTLFVELVLAFCLFSKRLRVKLFALMLGISLHMMFILAFGLISFFFAMCGILILYTIWQYDLSQIRFIIREKRHYFFPKKGNLEKANDV